MRLTLLFALGLCVSPLLAQSDAATKAPPAPTVTPDPAPENIEQMVYDVVDEVNSSRFMQSPYHIYRARLGLFGANEWIRRSKPWGAFDIRVQSVSKPQIKGEAATVVVKYRLEPRANEGTGATTTKAERSSDMRERSETVFLRIGTSLSPQSRVWQLIPPEREPTLVNGGPLLSFIIYKLAQRPLLSSNMEAQSLKRIKAVGAAALMLTQDYDFQFTFAPEYLREALTPYLEDEQSLFVPGTVDIYTFNSSLSGRYHFGGRGGLPDDAGVGVFPAPPEPFIKKPSSIVMFYEGHDQKPIFRYNGKAVICFANGNAALITPEEARDLIWNPD